MISKLNPVTKIAFNMIIALILMMINQIGWSHVNHDDSNPPSGSFNTDKVDHGNEEANRNTIDISNGGPEITLKIPQPVYRLRIQVIQTADSDGNNAGDIDADDLLGKLNGINQIYRLSGIQFDYDPNQDFVTINNTFLNRNNLLGISESQLVNYTDEGIKPPVHSHAQLYQDLRRYVADNYRGKIAMFFSKQGKLKYDKNKGNWAYERSGIIGSGRGRTVDMANKKKSAKTFAHELGHYLYNVHPFKDSNLVSIEQAADKIRKYVQAGNPYSEGINGLDGDRNFVLDTPPDVGEDLFAARTGGNKCGPIDNFIVPVEFPNSSFGTMLYKVEPDRENIMSYFNRCDTDKHFSPQQIEIMRDALENLNRHDLISAKFGGQPIFFSRHGTSRAGAVDKTDIVRVAHNRVVTSTIKNENLVLIVWDISDDGNSIIRSGDNRVSGVSDVSTVHMGLGNIATTLKTNQEKLKVITWNVTKSGQINFIDQEDAGSVYKISSTKVGSLQLVTAAINNIDDLQLTLWRVTADGTLTRGASAYRGVSAFDSKVSEVSVTRFDTFNVMTSVRNGLGDLQVISWKIQGDEIDSAPERMYSNYAGAITRINATTVATDVIATTVRNGSGMVQMIPWYVNPYSGIINRLNDILLPSSGVVYELDSVRLGTDMLVIATGNYNSDLELNLINNIEPSLSSQPVLKDTTYAGQASNISIARVGIK